MPPRHGPANSHQRRRPTEHRGLATRRVEQCHPSLPDLHPPIRTFRAAVLPGQRVLPRRVPGDGQQPAGRGRISPGARARELVFVLSGPHSSPPRDRPSSPCARGHVPASAALSRCGERVAELRGTPTGSSPAAQLRITLRRALRLPLRRTNIAVCSEPALPHHRPDTTDEGGATAHRSGAGDGAEHEQPPRLWTEPERDPTSRPVRAPTRHRRRWKTRIELAKAIFEGLEIRHNRRRRHSALDWRSRIEFENQNKIVVT